MRSLWLEEQKLEFRIDVPEPLPDAGQALVKVRLSGICSTDLELVGGYYPYRGIPGHEFVGEVISSPGDATWIGKRVVGEINIACGICDLCRAGIPRHCERRKTLGIRDWNGTFAEYLVLPLSNLHSIPESIPDKLAVFTEPLAAAYEILMQNPVTPADQVLVIGAGRLGQLVAQVLQETECHLDVLARHPKQQELLEKRHIHTITDEALHDKKYGVIVEATGSPEGFTLARKSIRPQGKIILKSTYKGNMEVNFSSLVVDEVSLIGSRCGPFEPALQLLAEGSVDPASLIDSIYPLEEGLVAFEKAALPGVLKVLIQL